MKLVWYRRDLRTIDHSALNYALATGEFVSAVYIATPEQWKRHQMSPMQADLIRRRLTKLCDELSQLNIPLYYMEVNTFDESIGAVKDIASAIEANEVLVNTEYEWNEQQRDQAMGFELASAGISFREFHDKCLMSPGEVLNRQGCYFKVFTPFQKTWRQLFRTPQVIPAVKAGVQTPSRIFTQRLFSENVSFSYPCEPSDAWTVDTDVINQRLRDFCRDKVSSYHQLRDFPAGDNTSVLSPYLAIGALSARQCVAALYAESDGGGLSQGAESWLNELIWREFYQHLIVFEPALCRGVCFHRWGEQLHWKFDEEAFTRWKEGMTGYPVVDAAMRQLKHTGWMHNRLRMIVASFLTKDLHISWRHGEDYFMSRLIDGDYASNNGGWQWSASTGCDGQPYFRIFNPVTQGQKFDPEGRFIRQWIPELKDVPDRWCHEPWKMPSVSSLLYPSPIVDHQTERKITLAIYQAAKEGQVYVS
ncbi:Deoxyribodipyrimidine photo-lyase [Vibrio aerogenes CECT 7868]|uniref:Deoxyribodipyrimidine photo-lyase n=1 Tax=Vibrio aerogenes CECT 7868 TaxID=1216006 RepID=A0A1M6BH26_9VIBR|nr:deoxyribodipyrimidine photo-lyase [Vibrio aerogenes]SHI47888.1 Deoxyribodipyrimidine photo-lyase [Vibrio aerogenes CECT 7868]